MADFTIAVKHMLAKEGGFVNSPFDAGKATNWGITEATARANGYMGDMKDLTQDQAVAIYETEYWDELCLDLIYDQLVAERIFDASVNNGQGTAAKWIQRLCNVFNRYQKDWNDTKVDGRIGPDSVMTINTAVKKCRRNILKGMECLQGEHYISLAENPERKDEMNINGWFNLRVEVNPE